MQTKHLKSGWYTSKRWPEIAETPSTLLIPGVLSHRIESRVRRDFNSSWRKYVNYLLNRYNHQARKRDGFPISEKLKTQYQRPGLALKRKNFRPENSSWQMLKELAELRSISMCRMFILLVLLDFKKRKLKSPGRKSLQRPVHEKDWASGIMFFIRTDFSKALFSRGIRMLH